MIRILPVVIVIWLVTIAPASAAAPIDYTRTILEQARSIVAGSQSHDEKLTALSVLFGKFLDTDEMGREALGSHWSAFTPDQQKNFLALFRALVERTYVQKLLLFENPDFVYAAQQIVGATAIVDTKIVTPRDQFDVTYRLIPTSNGWMATMITVEDVSLTANLGSQLNELLGRMSVDDLLALMRRKYGSPRGAA
jgi:phospholipid transport system substrate-binding protein